MTTVQNMLAHAIGAPYAQRLRLSCHARRLGAALPVACVVLAVVLTVGCAGQGPRLTAPNVLLSPYDSTDGDVLWAVAPLANESGTSLVDTRRVSDALAARITEVHGLAAVPVNRVLMAMRALDMSAITSPGDARRVSEILGVDGILVGSVTAYDPYDPPTLGLSVALFATRPLQVGDVDPRLLSSAFSDAGPTDAGLPSGPAAVVSQHLSGSDHEVLMRVQAFAIGRHDEETALGWRRYLASMDLYTEFAAYSAVRELLEVERLRIARVVRGEAHAAR